MNIKNAITKILIETLKKLGIEEVKFTVEIPSNKNNEN